MRCPRCPNEFAHMHRELGMPEAVPDIEAGRNTHMPVRDSLLRCDSCGRLWSQGFMQMDNGLFVETLKYEGVISSNG